MKICIVTPEFPPDNWGGLARTAERVARHGYGLGLDVHVASFTMVDDPLVLLDENRSTMMRDGLVIHRLKAGRQKRLEGYGGMGDSPHIRAIKMLYQSLEILHEKEKFDLFHSFYLYPGGYVSGILARRFAVKSIVTLVGNDVKRHFFQPEAVAMCKSGLDNADIVVALSGELLETANALTPVIHKGTIIYNSVTIPVKAWHHHSPHTEPYRIGSAGIFKYAKGLPYLLKAVAGLRERHNITLELVGKVREYEQDALHRMTERTGVGEILTLRQAVPHEDMHDWLMSLDVFVLPSVSEGCPNILMEAMACGVPSVSTRVGAVSELMESGISGFIVPYGNADALREALESLLAMPDRGDSLGKRARERMALFSPEREKDQWAKVYQRVTGN